MTAAVTVAQYGAPGVSLGDNRQKPEQAKELP